MVRPARRRVRAFWALAALTGAASVALHAQGAPLRTRNVPRGIVSFELAWTAGRAGAILDAWRGREAVARRQIQLDFGYLLLYPLPFALGCALLAERSGGRVGAVLSRAVLTAAPLDAAENVALLRMLDAGPSEAAARTAAVCATAKFALVAAAAAYLLVRGGATLIGRRDL